MVLAASHQYAQGRSQLPLLDNEMEGGRQSYDAPPDQLERRAFTRRTRLRSRSPSLTAAVAKTTTRKKYTYAAVALLLTLISFTVQTETAVYVQHGLGWKKAYCMLSWIILWPSQFVFLKLRKRHVAWRAFWRQHLVHLRATAAMVETQRAQPAGTAAMRRSPAPFLLRMTAVLTAALTVAAASWYVAVDMTTPSDLTAIYNCSAFFAYAFSVPLLKDRLRADKALSVAVAIAGVLVVAYGDAAGGAPKKTGLGSHGGGAGGGGGKQPLPSARAGGAGGAGGANMLPAAAAATVAGAKAAAAAEAKNRALGNIIIGVGSVLYGLYEVLYKKLACPPANTSPGRGMIFANTVGSLIGAFTLLVLWIPLVILHVTGVETFELPHGRAAWVLLISILANAVFSGSFLILISLTSPVLSSVAALLTIFIVALVDWLLTGQPLSGAALAGGALIVAAFGMLSWSTYREMEEERQRKRKRKADGGLLGGSDKDDDDDDDDDGDDDGEDVEGEEEEDDEGDERYGGGR